jgi:hypothetical protein
MYALLALGKLNLASTSSTPNCAPNCELKCAPDHAAHTLTRWPLLSVLGLQQFGLLLPSAAKQGLCDSVMIVPDATLPSLVG